MPVSEVLLVFSSSVSLNSGKESITDERCVSILLVSWSKRDGRDITLESCVDPEVLVSLRVLKGDEIPKAISAAVAA